MDSFIRADVEALGPKATNFQFERVEFFTEGVKETSKG